METFPEGVFFSPLRMEVELRNTFLHLTGRCPTFATASFFAHLPIEWWKKSVESPMLDQAAIPGNPKINSLNGHVSPFRRLKIFQGFL